MVGSISIADAGCPVFYSGRNFDRSLNERRRKHYIMSIYRVTSFQTPHCYSKTPSKSSHSRSSMQPCRSPSNRTCVTPSREAM